jgi:broad specificity phosphatase PhoE
MRRPRCRTQVILTSPLTRAIQTTLISYADHPEVKIIAEPKLTEFFKGAACSSGQTATVLRALYPTIDFSGCSERWSDGAETDEGFEQRIRDVKELVAQRPERIVGVMTHGWFIGKMMRQGKMPFFADFAICHFNRDTHNITVLHDFVLKGKVW